MGTEDYRLLVALVGGIFVLTLFFFVIYGRKIAGKKEMLKRQRDMQLKRIENLRNYRDNVLELVNDIENCLREEEAEPEKYQQLYSRCQRHSVVMITSDIAIDSLLAYKKSICLDKGINLKIDIAGKLKARLTTQEYISLLGNLLDNAIEASSKCKDRWIEVHSKCAKGQWVLKIVNTKDPSTYPINDGMATSKVDSINHGIGLRVVGRIVKEHSGFITFNDGGEVFETFLSIGY